MSQTRISYLLTTSRPRALGLALGLGLILLACSDRITDPGDSDGDPLDPSEFACAATATGSTPEVSLGLDLVYAGLHRPSSLAFAPGDDRFYVAEQYHGVRVLEANGVPLPERFIDLEGQLPDGLEQGVLGIVFDPGFQDNGFLYLTFTAMDGTLTLARYHVSDDPDHAAFHSILLEVPQPTPIHQGGQMEFGPDGMLYVALGDGGAPFDEAGHGQNPGALPGTLIRIDVRGGGDYAVPADNPFVGDPAGRDEVWAYGLRNPWSISFDEPRGCLYIADVGEAHREEVNAVRADVGGLNFGWNTMEGFDCFQNLGDNCDKSGLALPVLDYTRGDTCMSVIGGHVYRGSQIPGLEGSYLYVDFCDEWMRSFRLQDHAPVEEAEWDLPELEWRALHIGRDASGELYILTLNGSLYRLVGG